MSTTIPTITPTTATDKAAPQAPQRRIRRLAIRTGGMVAVFTVGWFAPWLLTSCAGYQAPRDQSWQALPMPEPVGEPIEHRAIVYHSPEGYQPLALDVFLPPESVPRPVPVLLGFHGGAFHSGNRGQYHGFARELARRGYAMVTPSYRLYGTALWPACVDDAVAAVGWVREHADEYGFDPARVGAMGRSAGAYLALMLATTQGADGKPLVRAAISEAGPTDLTPELWDGTMQGAFLAGFFGQHPREETSPAWRVADWTPPLLVFHGCQDTTVPFTQSYVLDIRMKSAGREMRLVPMPGTGHDPLSRNTAQGMREVFAFLDEHMK